MYPGWIALHGVTVSGRDHPSLVRFARALAVTGKAVIVPDIPSWRVLHIDRAAARPVISASAGALVDHPAVAPGGFGLSGFSFGATHALIAAAHPELRDTIRSVTAFGGYADLQRTARFLFTGRHTWSAREHRIDPDPYGRWILAANYLTRTDGYREMGGVAAGARRLATAAGRWLAYGERVDYDGLRMEIGAGLSSEERRLWPVIAPPMEAPAFAPEQAHRLADALAATALAIDPALDPAAALPALRARVVLGHGGEDRLIPCTETLRLRTLLPEHCAPEATITHLFAHSIGGNRLAWSRRAAEAARFVRLMDRAVRIAG